MEEFQGKVLKDHKVAYMAEARRDLPKAFVYMVKQGDNENVMKIEDSKLPGDYFSTVSKSLEANADIQEIHLVNVGMNDESGL